MKPDEPNSTLEFYNALASEYHHIFADWKQSVLRQGEVLDKIIRASIGRQPSSVLDCTCGIGTQAIGLAVRGYSVHATDLSRAAVERAKREAVSCGVSLTFGVADVRTLATQVPGSFEVIIACDNSLPHLLSDEDLRRATRNVWSKLQTNGLFLASIRDYDRIRAETFRATVPRVFDVPEGRRIAFQVWDWSETGRNYVVHQFIVRHVAGSWQTSHYATQYRALLRHELSGFLRGAGFSEIEWQMPDESGYYQPIVSARKR